jgi:Asp-tRNA(Asn)/Glu-tRNA(Gln) amidotransferase A subunit family amidase
MAQAASLDAELRAGNYRGPLHGIPWGAKDLLATKGYPTTWGASAYRDQVLDYDATVVERLDAAGAILVAKLTMGALAQGDRWFGGMTRNPWRRRRGLQRFVGRPGRRHGGGPGGFQHRHRDAGLHRVAGHAQRRDGPAPDVGRVSRHGAMALSWSMDKIGPCAAPSRTARWSWTPSAGPTIATRRSATCRSTGAGPAAGLHPHWLRPRRLRGTNDAGRAQRIRPGALDAMRSAGAGPRARGAARRRPAR